MEFNDNRIGGPSVVIIPERRYKSCRNCKWYAYNMLKSGFNPIYGHFCDHPEIKNTIYSLCGAGLSGNLIDDVTPEWCPYLKNNND